MNYQGQMRLVNDTLKRFPKFKQEIINYRKVWTFEQLRHFQIVIKGQIISDHVIRNIDLKSTIRNEVILQ